MEHKTIKPISIGGQAGGEKYIAQGILFKYPFYEYTIAALFKDSIGLTLERSRWM